MKETVYKVKSEHRNSIRRKNAEITVVLLNFKIEFHIMSVLWNNSKFDMRFIFCNHLID